MKVLLTGFEPFGQEKVNPSWETVKAFPELREDVEVLKICLPVSFQKAVTMLEQAVDDYRPDVVLSIGQAGGRCAVEVERVAINMVDSKKPDNDGYQPQGCQLRADAPNAYFSNLPLKRLVEAIQNEGIPAAISNSAGLYVCNSVFYTAMHLVYSKYPNMQAGFIHVPYLPSQVVGKNKQPSMSTETTVQALIAVIQELMACNQMV